MRAAYVIASLLLALAGCQPPASELPPLPELATDGLLPIVAAQLEAAHTAVVDDPSDAVKNGDYALALHAYDHSESAFTLYARARILAPKDPRWPYFQSAVSHRLGDLEGALDALDDALSLSPDHADIMAKRGEALFLLARFEEAEAQLGAVLEQNSSYPLANYYLAKIKMERAQWQEAASSFESLLQRGLDVREVHQSLGSIYRVLGRMDDAKSHLDRAASDQGLVIQSFDPVHLSVARLNLGDQPHLVKAREHYYRGDLETAEKELLVAIEKNPASIAGHSHLLRIYAEKSDLVGARHHYNRIMELEPGNSTAYSSWALALANNGQLAEAITAFQVAAGLTPSDPQVKVALAGALARSGRQAEALAELDAALELAPDHLNAQIMRGSALLVLGQKEEALTMLQGLQVPENDVRRVLVLRTLSRAHREIGQRDEAIRAMSNAALLVQEFDNPALAASIEAELDDLRNGQPSE